MKTLRVKFPRKPQFTPASLAPQELTRIERLVKLTFGRCHPASTTFERGEEQDRAQFYRSTALRESTHPTGIIRAKMGAVLMNLDAFDYFCNCYRYLLAVARNNGELSEYQHSAGKWAMASGYYG